MAPRTRDPSRVRDAGAVRIYTFADKRPDFIRWQWATFETHLRDDYAFVVVENAQSRRDRDEIHRLCDRFSLEVLSPPERHHENANVACSYPIDWVVQEHIARDTRTRISVIIDSDMFLLRPLSLVDFLDDAWIAGVWQARAHVRYLWNALVLINHVEVENIPGLVFACSGSRASPYFPTDLYEGDTLEGQHVDVGGPLHHYLREHPHCCVREIDALLVSGREGNLAILPESVRRARAPTRHWEHIDFEFLLDRHFFHYRSGSDWNQRGRDFHAVKTTLAARLLHDSLASAGTAAAGARREIDAAVTWGRRLRYMRQALIGVSADRLGA